MKEQDLLPRFRETLLDVLRRVAALRVRSVEEQSRILASPSERVDLRIDAAIGDEEWDLIAECKRVGHPGVVRTGLLQLQSYLEAFPRPKNRYGILIAPFISQESARLCEEAGVGYVDLAGNARLEFGPIYIETRSAENPFREQRAVRPLFTPKAGRVLRVLLAPPLRAWKVMELQQTADVSLGHVSTVRRNLLDRAWAEAGGRGLRVTEPLQLLRAWQASYHPYRISERKAYTLLHGMDLENAVRAAMAEVGNGAHAVYASFSAGRWLAPYARHATQFFYADRLGQRVLERQLELQSTAKGENVVLWEPGEDDVLSGRMEASPGVWTTGLVQTWLDLSAAGERGQEAAEHLLQEVLMPAWSGAVG